MSERPERLPVPALGALRRVRVVDRDFNVWQVGDTGPAMVLIHGLPSNHLLWRDVVPRLARRARVIAPDLLGYGRSDRPGEKAVDIAAQAAYVAALMDVLGVERATVVGHDIGGGVAQILAVRYDERVERLGLVDTVCYDAWPVLEAQAVKLAAPVVERLPAGLTTAGVKLGLRRGFAHQDRAATFLDHFLEPFSTAAGLDVFVEHTRALDSRYTQEIAPALPALRLPVAIIWGKQDPFLDPSYAERLAAEIPSAELTLIEEASHFAPADAPDAVAGALERLLDRAPGSTPHAARRMR